MFLFSFRSITSRLSFRKTAKHYKIEKDNEKLTNIFILNKLL